MPHKDPEVRKTYLKDWRKKNKEYVSKFDKARWRNNPARRKAQRDSFVSLSQMSYARQRNYGVNQEQYDSMVAEQSNLCALCGRLERRISYQTKKVMSLSVDHDHETRKVRELLCGDCNRGIGMFDESIELLEKAIQYLQKHKGKTNVRA